MLVATCLERDAGLPVVDELLGLGNSSIQDTVSTLPANGDVRGQMLLGIVLARWRDARARTRGAARQAITSQCLGPRSRGRCRINVAVRPRIMYSALISTARTAVWLRG